MSADQRIRFAAYLVAPLAVGGCTVNFDYLAPQSETSTLACTDGVDNDLDGLRDCADPDCGCNRCGEPARPDADVLGQVCNLDCECPMGMACNTTASRCAAAAPVGESAFFVSFLVEATAGRSDPTKLQNVWGEARFAGQRHRFEQALLSGNDLVFDRPGTNANDVPASLRIAYFPSFGPDATQTERLNFDDGLSAGAKGRTPQTLAAQLGFAGSSVDGAPSAVDQLAVIETSTLTLRPSSEAPAGFWLGEFRGTLRAATSYDRARGAACGVDDQGRPTVFDPEGAICRPRDDFELLGFMGCVIDESAPASSGGFEYLLRPWWSEVRSEGQGACVARRSHGVIEIRAMSGPPSRPWMLEIQVPQTRVASNVQLAVEAPPQDVSARIHFLNSRPDGPVFEVAIDASSTREITGVLDVELLTGGAQPRLMAWVDARVVHDQDGNTSRETAVPIEVDGAPVEAVYQVRGDHDFFAFTGRRGQWIRATARCTSDLVLRLHDADGTQLAETDDDIPQTHFDPVLVTRLPKDGTYYLETLSFREWFGAETFFGGSTGSPTVAVSIEQMVERQDPGRTAAAALRLTVEPDTSIWALRPFDGRDDIDVYRVTFTGPGQRKLGFGLMPPGPTGQGSTMAAGRVEFRAGDGTVLAAFDQRDGGVLMLPSIPAGTYDVVVPAGGGPGGASDHYAIRFVNWDEWQIEADDVGNDDPATAEPLRLERQSSGFLGGEFVMTLDRTDTDHLRIDVGADVLGLEFLHCAARSEGSGVLGLKVEVLSDDQNVLLTLSESGSNPARYWRSQGSPPLPDTPALIRFSAQQQDPTIAGQTVRCRIEVFR